MKTIIRILLLELMTCTILSCGKHEIEITGITLPEKSITIAPGESYTVQVEVTPPEAGTSSLVWTVRNEKVATVNDGVVTGVEPGRTSVTVSNISGSVHELLMIEVKKPLEQTTGIDTFVTYRTDFPTPVNGVFQTFTDIRNDDGKYTFYTGQNIMLRREIHPEAAGQGDFKYESTDPAVFSFGGAAELIEFGLWGQYSVVNLKNPGKCRVTITALDGSGVSAFWDLTVLLSPTDLYFKPSQVTMMTGTTAQIEVFPIPSDAVIGQMAWKIDDTSIAWISQDGIITAKTTGVTTIRAEALNGVSASCSLTVLPSGIENGHEGFIEEEW